MSGPSDDLNDLEGDIRHLSTLIETTFDVATGNPMPSGEASETMQKVLHLLWIARDLTERLSETASACHNKVIGERKAA
ncbi:MAG: hypothetical protein EOS05_10380 [Mesorhizobium sp.]|nr:MAG: hypothetical protein EOS05_10380 [Mesorhizobium sp.]